MDLVLFESSNAGHRGEPPKRKLLTFQLKSSRSYDKHSLDWSRHHLTRNSMEDLYSVYVISFPYITSLLTLAYQVACSVAPATAAESLYQFQLLRFHMDLGCRADISSGDMSNHPLAILLRRGRGERMGNIVNLFCNDHVSCGMIAEKLSLWESVKLLSLRHEEGTLNGSL
jgi:hypothetical protein